MHIRLRVSGLRELDERLKVLPQVVGKQVLKQALERASHPLLHDIRTHAPVLTGELRDSIAITTHPEEGQNEVKLQLGVTGLYYGHFQEFGTSRMRARPFVRPAWDRHAKPLIATFRELLRRAIDDYVRGNLKALIGPRRFARAQDRGIRIGGGR